MSWSDSREARNVSWELNKDLVYLTGLCQHFAGESEQTESKLTFWLHNFKPSKTCDNCNSMKMEPGRSYETLPSTYQSTQSLYVELTCVPQLHARCVHPVDVLKNVLQLLWPVSRGSNSALRPTTSTAPAGIRDDKL